MQTILDIIQKAGGWHPGLYLKIGNAPYMEPCYRSVGRARPRWDFPRFPSLTTANRTATSCTTRRCASSLASLALCTCPRSATATIYLGVEQWSRNIVRGDYIHLIALHEEHQRFAKTWDNNLRLQGFAEAFTDKCIRG